MKSYFRIALLGALLLQGCIVYKIDVQQGNEINQQMLDQLEPGMSKREVTRILGYPLINDPFHNDRWDYYYYLKTGKSGEEQQQSATLLFENDQLTEVRSSLSAPAESATTGSD
jgi:outer membrane protein assembly factor BamE